MANYIESTTGIRNFVFSELIKNNPTAFGHTITSRRLRQFENKSDRWKKLSDAKYDHLLESLGVPRFLPPTTTPDPVTSHLLTASSSVQPDHILSSLQPTLTSPTHSTPNSSTMSVGKSIYTPMSDDEKNHRECCIVGAFFTLWVFYLLRSCRSRSVILSPVSAIQCQPISSILSPPIL